MNREKKGRVEDRKRGKKRIEGRKDEERQRIERRKDEERQRKREK